MQNGLIVTCKKRTKGIIERACGFTLPGWSTRLCKASLCGEIHCNPVAIAGEFARSVKKLSQEQLTAYLSYSANSTKPPELLNPQQDKQYQRAINQQLLTSPTHSPTANSKSLIKKTTSSLVG